MMDEMPRVLVIEDEPSIVDVLEYNLRQHGHQPLIARDGFGGVQLALQHKPDLILLDVMLPGIDGYEVFRRVRAQLAVPVIFLTARDEEVDRVLGLEMGGDDYVSKPFGVRELMARIKVVLRRVQAPALTGTQAASVIRIGDLSLDIASQEAHWAGTPISLTSIQFEVLRTLAEQPNRLFDREQLLLRAWGYDAAGDTRAVDSMIKRLRARLREAGGDPECIVTLRDAGYKLVI